MLVLHLSVYSFLQLDSPRYSVLKAEGSNRFNNSTQSVGSQHSGKRKTVNVWLGSSIGFLHLFLARHHHRIRFSKSGGQPVFRFFRIHFFVSGVEQDDLRGRAVAFYQLLRLCQRYGFQFGEQDFHFRHQRFVLYFIAGNLIAEVINDQILFTHRCLRLVASLRISLFRFMSFCLMLSFVSLRPAAKSFLLKCSISAGVNFLVRKAISTVLGTL